MDFTLTTELLMMVPAITAILAGVKKTPLAKRLKGYWPLISIGLGIAASWYGLPDAALLERVMSGIVMGTMASGTHSAIKSIGTVEK